MSDPLKPKAPIRRAPVTNVTKQDEEKPAAAKPSLLDTINARGAQTTPIDVQADVAALPETMEPVTTGSFDTAAAALPKSYEDVAIPDPDAQIKEAQSLAVSEQQAREQALADVAAEEQAKQFAFLSARPSLVVYVSTGKRTIEQGRPASLEDCVEFKDGVYRTDDKAIAQALRSHPRFKQLFKEQTSAEQSHVLAQLSKRREMMRSATTAGATSSLDGNESLFNAQEAAIERETRSLVDL